MVRMGRLLAETVTFALVVALALALAAPPATGSIEFKAEELDSDESMWALYERWGAHYGVARDAGEKLRRFDSFKETARRVYAAHPGDRHYVVALNGFADMDTDELRAGFACERPVNAGGQPERSVNATLEATGGDDLPDAVDWRDRDCHGGPCVSSVKFQGECGSCWAFAAAAAVESISAINGYIGLVDLSPQELLDCDREHSGCTGGFAVKAFQYIIDNNGLASAATYPYTARQGTCKAASKRVAIDGFERVPSFHNARLMAAVNLRPVVVAIDASHPSFLDYPGGVYRGPCGHRLDHEMLLVGYGSTGTTFDDLGFWILKNSYGEKWGDKGYMRLLRDGETDLGMCGILTDASYPTAYPEWSYLNDYCLN